MGSLFASLLLPNRRSTSGATSETCDRREPGAPLGVDE